MPYLPLYVQDFLTDEKLIECSAEATGVYIRLLCIMHKSHDYGMILLKQKDKQKDKQNASKISEFACKLAKQMPWDEEIILRGLTELATEGVITIDGDTLFQKRMVKDGQISEKRANAGQKGGQKSKSKSPNSSSSSSFASGFACDFAQAKIQANSENENENDNDNEIETDSREKGNGENAEVDRARGSDPIYNPDLARVMNRYMDSIDPTPSTTCTEELIYFTNRFGADVVLHAIGRGQDQLKSRVTWAYIKGILRGYVKENVQTLGDVLRMEEEYEEGAGAKTAQRGRKEGGHGTGTDRASPGAASKWTGKLKGDLDQ